MHNGIQSRVKKPTAFYGNKSSVMVEFPGNTTQHNILFLPSNKTSLKAPISFPKGNRKSMKTSTRKVSQVLQRGNRKSIINNYPAK